MSPHGINKLIGGALLTIILIMAVPSTYYIVDPGYRGVEVTLGRISEAFKPEGFGFKVPFITQIYPIMVRQQTHSTVADCYSYDLQQIKIEIRVLCRIPEASGVKLFRAYEGEVFESLIEPRVSEAVKELTAAHTAEMIVKKREEIKTAALELARKKIGDILIVEDIVFQDITLSKELESAIEAKMVQEQEAAKAKYTQQKVEIEAATAVIKANGDAQSLAIRGKAVRENPNLIKLQIVEKWDGISPLVVGSSAGGGLLLNVDPSALDKQPPAARTNR